MKLKRFKKLIAAGLSLIMLMSLGITASAYEAQQVIPEDPTVVADAEIWYAAHVQNVGWQNAVMNNKVAGTTGQALRMEALRIDTSKLNAYGFQVRAHVQNVGWMDIMTPDANGVVTVGTTGQGLRLEAIQISASIPNYVLYYQVHVQNIGWMPWVQAAPYYGSLFGGLNNEDFIIGSAGTSGRGLRIEAIRFDLRSWATDGGGGGYPEPADPDYAASVGVEMHVARFGWLDWVWSTQQGTDGYAGTTGRGIQAEAVRLQTGNTSLYGHIEYRTHVQDKGWLSWVRDGQTSGTTGQGLRMEAVEIRLTGELAQNYTVEYRAHVAGIDWQGWVRNGATAGTTGRMLAIEALEVRLVPR